MKTTADDRMAGQKLILDKPSHRPIKKNEQIHHREFQVRYVFDLNTDYFIVDLTFRNTQKAYPYEQNV